MPSFDARVVQYPSVANLRDYMSWRQVDCKCDAPDHTKDGGGKDLYIGLGHINNLYNTTFWALVEKGGIEATKAEAELKVGLLLAMYGFDHSLMSIS